MIHTLFYWKKPWTTTMFYYGTKSPGKKNLHLVQNSKRNSEWLVRNRTGGMHGASMRIVRKSLFQHTLNWYPKPDYEWLENLKRLYNNLRFVWSQLSKICITLEIWRSLNNERFTPGVVIESGGLFLLVHPVQISESSSINPGWYCGYVNKSQLEASAAKYRVVQKLRC